MLRTLLGAFRLLAGGGKAPLVLCAVLGAVAALLSTAQPILFGRAVDALSAAPAGAGRTAWPLLAAFAGVALVFLGVDYANRLASDRLTHRGMNLAMARFAAATLRLSQDFHANVHSAWLAKVMATGTEALFSLWLNTFRMLVPNLASVLVTVPLALFLDVRLGGLFVGLLVAFSTASTLVVRRAVRAQKELEAIRGRIYARTGDALGNLRLLQAYDRVEDELRDLDGLLEERIARQLPLLRLWAAYSALPDAAFTLCFAGIFVAGTALVGRGEASVGEVVTLVTLASALVPRIAGIQMQVAEALWRSAQIGEFLDIVERQPTVTDPPGAKAPAPNWRARGHIRLEGVTFAYPGGAGVHGIDLDIRPGECVALVGHTGAGKSTLANLLLRFADPQSGRITLDGIDLRSLPLADLRAQIAVVFQDPFLLNRSIADNLRVGAPDAGEERLRGALRRAQADGFVARMPDGLAAQVGERGVKLSGGEKQRLSIARAMLKDAPVVVLDEATSALDARTERAIQASLDELSRGRTTIVIAHRLSTVMRADRIVVLDRGCIAEVGGFHELVARGGLFAKLVEAQTLDVPATAASIAAE